VTRAGDQGRMAHAPKLTGCRVPTSRGDHPLSGVESATADHAGAIGSSATAEPAAVSSARENFETGGLATTASRPTSSSCTQASRCAELPAHGYAKDRQQVLSLGPDRMVARAGFPQFDDRCQLQQGARHTVGQACDPGGREQLDLSKCGLQLVISANPVLEEPVLHQLLILVTHVIGSAAGQECGNAAISPSMADANPRYRA
jgi:hypothetical protein